MAARPRRPADAVVDAQAAAEEEVDEWVTLVKTTNVEYI